MFIITGCDTNTSTGSNFIQYNAELSIKNNNGDIYIEIYDYPEIVGFQFDLNVQGNAQIDSVIASGGLSEEMLSSRNVIPEKLTLNQYQFKYPDLNTALEAV